MCFCEINCIDSIYIYTWFCSHQKYVKIREVPSLVPTKTFKFQFNIAYSYLINSQMFQINVGIYSIFLFYVDAIFEFEGVPKLCCKQLGTPQAQSPVAVQASGSSHLRLFQGGRCRLGGAQREKQVDTGCSGARSRKGAGPLGTTDTTGEHARHADHQTLAAMPPPMPQYTQLL